MQYIIFKTLLEHQTSDIDLVFLLFLFFFFIFRNEKQSFRMHAQQIPADRIHSGLRSVCSLIQFEIMSLCARSLSLTTVNISRNKSTLKKKTTRMMTFKKSKDARKLFLRTWPIRLFVDVSRFVSISYLGVTNRCAFFFFFCLHLISIWI